jgi:3-methyladenine DNA glycosylase AlkD
VHLTKKEKRELSFLEAKMATHAREELAELLCAFVRVVIDRMANDARMEDVVDAVLSHVVSVTHRERYRMNVDAMAAIEPGARS